MFRNKTLLYVVLMTIPLGCGHSKKGNSSSEAPQKVEGPEEKQKEEPPKPKNYIEIYHSESNTSDVYGLCLEFKYDSRKVLGYENVMTGPCPDKQDLNGTENNKIFTCQEKMILKDPDIEGDVESTIMFYRFFKSEVGHQAVDMSSYPKSQIENLCHNMTAKDLSEAKRPNIVARISLSDESNKIASDKGLEASYVNLYRWNNVVYVKSKFKNISDRVLCDSKVTFDIEGLFNDEWHYINAYQSTGPKGEADGGIAGCLFPQESGYYETYFIDKENVLDSATKIEIVKVETGARPVSEVSRAEVLLHVEKFYSEGEKIFIDIKSIPEETVVCRFGQIVGLDENDVPIYLEDFDESVYKTNDLRKVDITTERLIGVIDNIKRFAYDGVCKRDG